MQQTDKSDTTPHCDSGDGDAPSAGTPESKATPTAIELSPQSPSTTHDSSCSCDTPGFCQRYSRNMSKPLWTICRGETTNISPEQCAAYRERWSKRPAEPTVIKPKKEVKVRPQCKHLGTELRTEGCKTCKGNVQIKIFSCEVHGRATIGQELKGIACCAKCPDYQGVNDA